MINSISKSWFIGSSRQQKPVKGIVSEISSVEHVAELVQVVLREVRLNAMIGIKELPFCIADGNMNQGKHIPDLILFDDLEGMVFNHVLYPDIRFGSVGSYFTLRLDVFGDYLTCGFGLEIREDNHLDMSNSLGAGVRFGTFPFVWSAFCHHKDRRFTLASFPTFLLGILFIIFRLRGEEAIVNLHHTGKLIAVITLTHHVAQLVKHLPDRLVTFMPQLPLALKGRESLFRGCQKMDGIKPVHERQLGVLHHCPCRKCRLMPAFGTDPAFLALVPILFVVATFAAYNTFLFADFAKTDLAGLLGRKKCGKFNQFHGSFIHDFNHLKVLIPLIDCKFLNNYF
jgi:hypothetical protein